MDALNRLTDLRGEKGWGDRKRLTKTYMHRHRQHGKGLGQVGDWVETGKSGRDVCKTVNSKNNYFKNY